MPEIILKPYGGEDVRYIIKLARAIVQVTQRPVSFTHNEVMMVVSPGDSEDQAYERWARAFDKKHKPTPKQWPEATGKGEIANG
jgi:hypothetical protein